MSIILMIVIIILAVGSGSCTIAGISYMDPLNFRPRTEKPGSDPCNPLYWYPKEIPEYCYIKSSTLPSAPSVPIPLPIPVPIPQSLIPAMPIAPVVQPSNCSVPLLPPPMLPLPMMPSPLMPPPMMPPPMMPPPMMPPPMVPPIIMSPSIPPVQVPYGLPIVPNGPLLPVAGVPYHHMPQPYPYYPPRRQIGMVPGLPGLVSRDGGINILPFSDAYSEMLENHKNKMLRKQLQRVMDEYEDSSFNNWNGRRKGRRRNSYKKWNKRSNSRSRTIYDKK